MNVITRKEAHDKGLRHFYTGRPCNRGHDRERSVASGACLGCLAHYASEYAAKFKASQKAETMGLTTTEVRVDARHIPTLHAFVDLLRTCVVTGAAPPLVPHHDDIGSVNTFIAMLSAERGAAPPAPEVFDPYPMWVRIHGLDIADQMRAGGA